MFAAVSSSTQTEGVPSHCRTQPYNNCCQQRPPSLSVQSAARRRSTTLPVAARSVSASGCWRSSGRRRSATESDSARWWLECCRWWRQRPRRRSSRTAVALWRSPRPVAAERRWPVVQPRRRSADPARKTASRSCARHYTATGRWTCRCSQGRRWSPAGSQSDQGRRHGARPSSSREVAARRRPAGTSAGTAGTLPRRQTRSWRSRTSRGGWSRRMSETRSRGPARHRRSWQQLSGSRTPAADLSVERRQQPSRWSQ